MWPAERTTWLYIGIVISLAVHAAIISIHFKRPYTPRPPVESLEVTLVNTRTETVPATAQVLAQQNLNAGGAGAEHLLASSPLPRTAPEAAQDVILEALRKRQAELEAQQEQLLTLLEARLETPAAKRPDLMQQSETPGRDNQNQESALLSARIAAIKEQIQQYNARPRQQFVGPSARQAGYALYVESWRQKIEQVGTTHYPPEARGKIYGALQLTVYIRRDGSLERVEINQASEEPVLNLAARRIVQLAAPFAPLPPDIARDTDVLAITRTWHFTNDQLITR